MWHLSSSPASRGIVQTLAQEAGATIAPSGDCNPSSILALPAVALAVGSEDLAGTLLLTIIGFMTLRLLSNF